MYYIVSLRQTTTKQRRQLGGSDCIISFLYIKPQHPRIHAVKLEVILYRFSTSNHNLFNSCSMRSAVVLYRFSTSNHNSTLLACSQPYVVLYRFSTSSHNFPCMPFRLPRVVLYRFSTSNHNVQYATEGAGTVVLYRFSTSNHNARYTISVLFRLYYIVSLHQTTTQSCGRSKNETSFKHGVLSSLSRQGC